MKHRGSKLPTCQAQPQAKQTQSGQSCTPQVYISASELEAAGTRQETCPLRSYRREWAPLRCGRSVAWVVKKLECLFTKATRGEHKKTYKYIFYIGNIWKY